MNASIADNSKPARAMGFKRPQHEDVTREDLQQQKRISWAIFDWEESIEDFDSCDENDESETYLFQDVAQDRASSSQAGKAEPVDNCISKSLGDTPRRGSLLELILREDAPIISGCRAPLMRQLGSMHEKIISDDDANSLSRLQELQVNNVSRNRRATVSL